MRDDGSSPPVRSSPEVGSAPCGTKLQLRPPNVCREKSPCPSQRLEPASTKPSQVPPRSWEAHAVRDRGLRPLRTGDASISTPAPPVVTTKSTLVLLALTDAGVRTVSNARRRPRSAQQRTRSRSLSLGAETNARPLGRKFEESSSCAIRRARRGRSRATASASPAAPSNTARNSRLAAFGSLRTRPRVDSPTRACPRFKFVRAAPIPFREGDLQGPPRWPNGDALPTRQSVLNQEQ